MTWGQSSMFQWQWSFTKVHWLRYLVSPALMWYLSGIHIFLVYTCSCYLSKASSRCQLGCCSYIAYNIRHSVVSILTNEKGWNLQVYNFLSLYHFLVWHLCLCNCYFLCLGLHVDWKMQIILIQILFIHLWNFILWLRIICEIYTMTLSWKIWRLSWNFPKSKYSPTSKIWMSSRAMSPS